MVGGVGKVGTGSHGNPEESWATLGELRKAFWTYLSVQGRKEWAGRSRQKE